MVMPLESRLFSGQKRFEDCLISDPAHIVPGDKGDHVTAIQIALQFLDQVRISEGELAAGSYGPSTVAAVLAYKKRRGIINRSYQSTADNIVGKMTIASLDAEMVAVELRLDVMLRPSGMFPHPVDPAQSDAAIRAAARPPGVGPPLAVRGGPEPVGAGSRFGPPLSTFPPDLLAVIERTNPLKKPGDGILLPFVSNELTGPRTPEQLTADFKGQPTAVRTLLDIYERCKKFDLWRHVNTLLGVFGGTGARGLKAKLFNEDIAVKHLEKLSETLLPVVPIAIAAPGLAPLATISLMCKDVFNVHGERDSWREVVMLPLASGLHYCVPQPHVRNTAAIDAFADIHIDDFQQSQVTAAGHCVPYIGVGTIAHVVSVAPFLVLKTQEKVDGIMKKIPKPRVPKLPNLPKF